MAHTRESLLEVLRRTTDPGWLDPILADPDSLAVLNAELDALVMVSDGTTRGCDAGLISLAPGGQPGVTTVVAQRSNTTQTFTIPKGYLFRTDKGVQLVLAQDIVGLAGQAMFALPLQTVRQSDLVNTVDGALDFLGAGSFLPGAVDPQSPIIIGAPSSEIIIGPPGTPTNGHALTLVSSDPITGGALDYLSAHGNERGQRRQADETTEDYRLRVRNIPDTVSPAAIIEAVRGVADQAGIGDMVLREPYGDGADPLVRESLGLDRIETYFASADYPNIAGSPKTDFVDDPFFGPTPLPGGFVLRDRETVSAREGRAYFRVETPAEISDPDGLRFFADHSFMDDPVWGYLDVGDHPTVIASLMAIWEEANRKRAAAVQFDVLLPLAVEKVDAGHAVAGAATSVASVTADAGTSWLMVDLVAGHDAALSGVAPVPADDFHQVKFTFHDATTFTTPAYRGLDSEHLSNRVLAELGFPFGKRVTQIEGLVGGAGVRDLNVVIDARVIVFKN